MMGYFGSGNNPLHEAALQNDMDGVESFCMEESWLNEPNSWGFTPAELAKLLGRRRVLDRLETQSEISIRFRSPEDRVYTPLDSESFQEVTAVRYWPWPWVHSWAALKQIIRLRPSRSLEGCETEARRAKYLKAIWAGELARVTVGWVNPAMGYGLFTSGGLSAGDFVGAYSGEIRRMYRSFPDQNDYCLSYPCRWEPLQHWIVDAIDCGGLMRFANHADQANLDLECVVDRGLVLFFLRANRKIFKGEELRFDYGESFWKYHKKAESMNTPRGHML